MKIFQNRKALFAILMMGASLTGAAGPVHINQARALAAKVLKKNVEQSPAKSKAFANGGNKAAGNASASSPYYIFNAETEGEGFAIISGDDRVSPVIGYSNSGTLNPDDMPEPLRELLAVKAEAIEKIQVDSVNVLVNYPKRPKAFVKPLTRSTWNQNSPYDLYTPMVYGQHCPTGCVITAAAQVMYFHKWPKERPESRRETCNGLAYYDWENMKDDAQESTTDAQRQAVATLMADLGITFRATYTPSNTMCDQGKAWQNLENLYGYSTRMLEQELISNENYFQQLYSELSDGYPIFVTGGDHAFYYDGYDENGLIHCNWGWGGQGDGYYDILTVSIGGNPYTKGIFWQRQCALFAHPKDGKHSIFPPQPVTLCTNVPGALGINEKAVSRTGSATAILLSVASRNLVQGANGTYTGEMGIGLFDNTGECIHIFPWPYDNVMTWSTFYEYNNFNNAYNPWKLDFSTLPDLPEGTYSLKAMGHQLLDKEKETWENWTLLLNGNSVGVTVTKDSVFFRNTSARPNLEVVGMPEVVVPVYTNGGVQGGVSMKIANTSPTNIHGNLLITLFGKGDLEGETFTVPDVFAGGQKAIPPLSEKQVSFSLYTSYADETGSHVLSAGDWGLRLKIMQTDNDGNRDTVDIHVPEEFTIHVAASSNPRIIVSRVKFFDGDQEAQTNEFDPNITDHIAMGLHTIVRYIPDNYTNATLRYRLKDLNTDSIVYTGEAFTASLPFTSGDGDNDVTNKTRQSLSFASLTVGHTYEVHVDVMENGQWSDRWNTSVPRRTFTLVEPYYYPVYIPASGYTTLSSTDNFTLTTDNLEGVYAVTGLKEQGQVITVSENYAEDSGNDVSASEDDISASGDDVGASGNDVRASGRHTPVFAANTGYLIKGNPGSTLTMMLTVAPATVNVEDNLLKPVLFRSHIMPNSEDTLHYSLKEGWFLPINEPDNWQNCLEAGSAYLALPTNVYSQYESANIQSIATDDETLTAIQSAVADKNNAATSKSESNTSESNSAASVHERYNLFGQKVKDGYKGIIIQKGKKIILK